MAVTAYPVILVDSATGSDSAASGAGPATALTGTGAGTDAGGTVVSLDGSPSLAGVNTDGSHVIYLVDSTAGHRNFAAINDKNDTTKTVTVEQAFTGSLPATKSWAIGGKRASIGAASSKLLFDNNSAAGDAMPGWCVEMQSGHNEPAISATLELRRSGDTTVGPIILRGASGAATRPIVTFSNNGVGFNMGGNCLWLQDFELRNTNTTKTSKAISFTTASMILLQRLVIAHADTFGLALYIDNVLSSSVIDSCIFKGLGSYGCRGGMSGTLVSNNIIAACGNHGVLADAGLSGTVFVGNLFAFNNGDGLDSISAAPQNINFRHNIFHGNASDGIELTCNDVEGAHLRLSLDNNIFSLNGGYGINFSGGSITAAAVKSMLVTIRNNNFYTNGVGKYSSNITTSISQNESTADPSSGLADQYKDYAGTTGGTNFNQSVLKDLGYPSGGTAIPLGMTGSTQGYQDIGVGSQHTAGGGGGPLLGPGRLVRN